MIFKFRIATHSGAEPLEFALDRQKTLLGRHKDNHIRFKEKFISAYHATFFRGDADEIYIEDCDSRNGVYINGRRLEGIAQVYAGDRIHIAEIQGIVQPDKDSSTALEANHGSHHNYVKTSESDLHLPTSETEEQIAELKLEMERLEKQKRQLETETEKLSFQRDRLAKDHDDLTEDLMDTRRKVEDLIDLECELQESVSTIQASSKISRKKVFAKGDDSNCTTTERRICRDLIRWLENLEEAQKDSQPSLLMNKTNKTLFGLEDAFIELLKNYSVNKVNLDPGTHISPQARGKIQLVSIDEIDDAKLRKEVASQRDTLGSDVVLRTLSPGFIYNDNGKEHVLRKAEVIVS